MYVLLHNKMNNFQIDVKMDILKFDCIDYDMFTKVCLMLARINGYNDSIKTPFKRF